MSSSSLSQASSDIPIPTTSTSAASVNIDAEFEFPSKEQGGADEASTLDPHMAFTPDTHIPYSETLVLYIGSSIDVCERENIENRRRRVEACIINVNELFSRFGE
jgi:hypothetical protein